MTAPITVYVAGSSRDLERAERVIAALRAIPGVVVPVDWPAAMRKHGPDDGLSDDNRERFAAEDANGAINCTVFLLLRPTLDAPSAGAWAELGMALSASTAREELGELRTPLVIIGGEGTRCIFDALADVTLKTDDEAVAIVREIAEERAA